MKSVCKLFSVLIAAALLATVFADVERAQAREQGAKSEISTSAAGSQAPLQNAGGDPDDPTGALSLRRALAAALVNNPGLADCAWEVEGDIG